MPVENATLISDLNALWPTHDDGLDNADAHARLTKQALLNTFKNITAVVTATADDLNNAADTRTRVGTLETNRARNDQGNTLTGDQTINGNVTLGAGKAIDAPSIKQGGNVLLPTGIITMWSGASTAIPAGWHLCDGTNGTPDLRDRFILGAGNSYAAGLKGGAASVALSVANLPSHTHGLHDPGHSHTVADPGHSHSVYDPGHTHGVSDPGHSHATNARSGGVDDPSHFIAGGTQWDLGTATINTATTGVSVQGSGSNVSLYGSSTGISLYSAGTGMTIDSTGSGTPVNTMPPYYALCFIMKL